MLNRSVGNRSYLALCRLRRLMHADMPHASATTVNVTRMENADIAADARGPAWASSESTQLLHTCADVLMFRTSIATNLQTEGLSFLSE